MDQDMGDYLNDPSGRLDFRDMPASIIQVRHHPDASNQELLLDPIAGVWPSRHKLRQSVRRDWLTQVNYPMTVTSGSPVAHTVYNGATCAATPEPSQALALVNVPTLTCGVGWLQAPDPGHTEEPRADPAAAGGSRGWQPRRPGPGQGWRAGADVDEAERDGAGA